MKVQAQVRDLLAAEGIDYIVKVNGGHIRGISGQRACTGSFGENMDAYYEYRIFVKKIDYDAAARIIKGSVQ